MKNQFDIAVIGSGPGGYVAAIKAAQAGKQVCLIEKGEIGGTCLNVGCIPTKTLLAGSEMVRDLKIASEFGIKIGSVEIDYSQMKKRKDAVIGKMRRGLEGLITSNGITIIRGAASFVSAHEIAVQGEIIRAEKIIIASGSEPLDIPAFPCDHTRVMNSSSILEMTTLPKHLVIIGGGYIGCEFASLYSALGVKVTILEALDSIVKPQGQAISEALTRSFKAQGIEIKTGVTVERIDKADQLTVQCQGGFSVLCDVVLVSIGRKVVSSSLQLQNAGVKLAERGVIPVNEKMETNVSHIYAIGDVTGKVLLAHVASHQGIVAALNAIGHKSHMNYDAVPAVIFTHPEIAMVGMSLERAKEAGFDAQLGKFPFQALGKAVATGHTEGFAHVIIDRKTGQILGAEVVGHDAGTLISEMTLAIANELTVECITETIHAHPTLPEAWLEASLMACEMPLHLPPTKKK